MPCRVTHFEIYGDKPEKLAAFYAELLGWRIERAEGVDYWRIQIETPVAVSSAGVTYRPAFGLSGWMPFIEVELLSEALSVALRLGGAILKDKTAVPRTAWHAVIADFGRQQLCPMASGPHGNAAAGASLTSKPKEMRCGPRKARY